MFLSCGVISMEILMEFHFAAGTPRYKFPAALLIIRQVSGEHHTLVVWCSKMTSFVLIGCLFDTLCLAVTICLLVADVSLLPPGVFFSGCPAQSVLLASSHPPTD